MLMIKNLLATALVATASLAAAASTVTVWEGKVEFTGWDKSLNVPASEFAAIAAGDVLTATTANWLEYVEGQDYTSMAFKTNSDGWPELTGSGWYNPTAASPEVSLELTEAQVAELKATGLIIQGSNLSVTKVTFTSAADIDPNVLFEGEAAISGWNKAGDISAAKLAVGDVLEYTFSEAGAESGQVLVKGSDWSNLLGTAKMNHSDIATGKVRVGVTAQMLETCGGTIFVQGDGGMVLTKVTLIPAGMSENAADYITYGNRLPGVQNFATIKEGTEQLEVVFATKPGWSQIADSNWASMVDNEAAVSTTENADGTVSVIYPITPAIIETINAAKEFIVNTDAEVVGVKYVSTSTGLAAIAADADAPAEYYDLQGRRVANPSAGLYIVRQGSKVSKVVF